MKIVSVGLKGWERDGHWNWTPEVQCEYDPLARSLELHQQDGIQVALESMRQALQGAVELFTKKEAIITESKPGQTVLPVVSVEPYSPELLRWSRCPTCGNANINRTSKAGRAYQCCQACKVFLEADGTVKEMTK